MVIRENSQPSRRNLLRGALTGAGALGITSLLSPMSLAALLRGTPPLTEGPFYPDHLPLDQDNDLVVVGNSAKLADGEISHLFGKILDLDGNPVKDAEIEIWQCDAHQVYLNSRDSDQKKDQQDKNFQGYGKFLTVSDGGYRFRTIKPVPYPGRPAGHIHYRIHKQGKLLLTSQIFVAGAPGNERDMVFRQNRDPDDRRLVQADFLPMKESKTNELSAKFDIIIGRTPRDQDDDDHDRQTI